MARCNLYLVLVAVLVLSFLESGSCLSCYNCTSVANSHCKDAFVTTKIPLIKCPDSTICFKQITPVIVLNPEGSQQNNLSAKVSRGCRAPDFCKNVQNFATHCSTCNQDGCNSGSVALPSFIIISFYVVKCFINY